MTQAQSPTPQRFEVRPGTVWKLADAERFPGVWKVVKVNPRTVALVDAGGRQVRADVEYLRRTNERFEEQGTTFYPRPGTLVTSKLLTRYGVTDAEALVVIKFDGATANVVRVNATDNRYWRVPLSHVAPFVGTLTF